MNQLRPERRLRVLQAIVDGGMSVRACERLLGVNRNTVVRLARDVGEACLWAHDRMVAGVPAVLVEVDEMYTYVQSRRNPRWVYIAVDANSRLIIAYRVGRQIGDEAAAFLADTRARVEGSPRIVRVAADQRNIYDRALAGDWPGVDAVRGPGKQTNHVERLNGSVRLHLRRFTRRSQGFSKTEAALLANFAMFAWWYNFCRVHSTLRRTPAEAAGLTDRPMPMEEMLAIEAAYVRVTGRRGCAPREQAAPRSPLADLVPAEGTMLQ